MIYELNQEKIRVFEILYKFLPITLLNKNFTIEYNLCINENSLNISYTHNFNKTSNNDNILVKKL